MNERHRLPSWLRRMLARRLARPAAPPRALRRRQACLYKLDRIGDFVLASGALRLLIGHFGAANCRLIVSTQAAPFAAAEFPEVDQWVAPAGASGVWRQMHPLRRQVAPEWATERFDALVCLRHARSLYRDLTLSWLSADHWHGLSERPSAHALSSLDNPEPAAGYPATAAAPWCRELLAHRAVLGAVLGREIAWEEMQPRLHSARAAAGDAILLCPFGSDRIRDYPLAAWIEAWRGAIGPGAEVRVLGSGARREELEQFATGLRDAGARAEVATDLSPAEFVQSVAQAKLVLTVESAAAHLATALEKPAVILVGGGHPGWFAPWGMGQRQRWVRYELDCYGCNWECRRPRVECLLDLPAAAVARAITEVLPHG